jgi:hypothetical protein
VADDRVADGQVFHRRADGVDPPGVLVAEDDGQVGRDDVGEPAVDDVQVGAAQPGAAKPAQLPLVSHMRDWVIWHAGL